MMQTFGVAQKFEIFLLMKSFSIVTLRKKVKIRFMYCQKKKYTITFTKYSIEFVLKTKRIPMKIKKTTSDLSNQK
jgi:hypothetical protein